ncbi:MAG: serine hydrolase, partial [Bacilli bacterium]
MKLCKNNNFISKASIEHPDFKKVLLKKGTLLISAVLLPLLVACFINAGARKNHSHSENVIPTRDLSATESSMPIESLNEASIEELLVDEMSSEDTTSQDPSSQNTTSEDAISQDPSSQNTVSEDTTIVENDLTTGIKNDQFDTNCVETNHDEFTISQELTDEFNSLIANHSSSNSFYAVSVDGKFSIGCNIDHTIFGGCIAKAPYALYCYKQIEMGNGTFDEIKTYEEKHYHGGSGTIQYSSYGTEYTLDEILFNMLDISDNAAFYMMQDRFPRDGYNEMIKEIGCQDMLLLNSTRFGNVTAREVAMLWSEIYKYSQESEYGVKLLDVLLNAKYNYIKDSIPEYEIAHKSGWTQDVRNDAGIVYSQTPYIITVLTPNDKSYMDQVVKLID